ncbi:MAG: hypothetical protein ACOH1V_10575 [Stenotrophomonas sp.]
MANTRPMMAITFCRCFYAAAGGDPLRAQGGGIEQADHSGGGRLIVQAIGAGGLQYAGHQQHQQQRQPGEQAEPERGCSKCRIPEFPNARIPFNTPCLDLGSTLKYGPANTGQRTGGYCRGADEE